MGTNLEIGIGIAAIGTDFEKGYDAARQALSQLDRFAPRLAIAYISAQLDVAQVHHGILDVIGECPLIGTSSAREIGNGYKNASVVVNILASPHCRVHVGLGEHVNQDYHKAIQAALNRAGVEKYFNPKEPLHQILKLSAEGLAGVSPAFMIVFTPGVTTSHWSLSHAIHTELRKSSANRIPIFGGSSSDNFDYTANYQIVNDRITEDGIAIAFVNTELLFGMGLAHGFVPTTKRALVTKASGQILIELDNRPAAEVYAQFQGMSLEKLNEDYFKIPPKFQDRPMGCLDIYGNSILYVPEKIFPDGSILFPNLIENHTVVTMMRSCRKDIVNAGWAAYNKAISNGGLSTPSLALICSCALRLMPEKEQPELSLLRKNANIPMCGFYTYGEKGIFDDGLPVYSNFSISILVLADELNPIASLINRGQEVYREFDHRINQKASQIQTINRVNRVIQDADSIERLVESIDPHFKEVFPWAQFSFYAAREGGSGCHRIFEKDDVTDFPDVFDTNYLLSDSSLLIFKLESQEKLCGYLIVRNTARELHPDEDEHALIESLTNMISNAIHRIQADEQLKTKLLQLDILGTLGRELSLPLSFSDQAKCILKHLCDSLQLAYISLWLVDQESNLLVKEAVEGLTDLQNDIIVTENDELIAKSQLHLKTPIYCGHNESCPCNVSEWPDIPYNFISVPAFSGEELKGVLNLFIIDDHRWTNGVGRVLYNVDFLQNICNQVAFFIDSRTHQRHALFYKEMNHRVKNNLQNIASLLRMQSRRLDHLPAKIALNDSISRIMSIALVHECLSNQEIGLVDLGQLIQDISRVADVSAARRPVITLDITGPEVMVSAKQATPLALVLNELIQNAVQHGGGEAHEGKIGIKIETLDGQIAVTVKDNGPGLADGFDPQTHGNLGLTIVQTLVKEELKGEFSLVNDRGTLASMIVPIQYN